MELEIVIKRQITTKEEDKSLTDAIRKLLLQMNMELDEESGLIHGARRVTFILK